MKYQTEEERLAARKAYMKQYYQANREKMLEQMKLWIEANKDKLVEYNKQYYQTNRDKRLEYAKQYNQTNKEKRLEQMKQYNQVNREKLAEYHKQYIKQYNKTPIGRASNLVSAYAQSDRKSNRGECTLTAQWIMDNIFTSKCHYCGESDWIKLGCDRIDNSLPHTEDNVVPCCEECNKNRGTKSYEDFLAECEQKALKLYV